MGDIKAGVVLVSKFCTAGAAYNNYVNYIDRDEAVRNDNIEKFSLYNEYMGNPSKTTGIFTADKDFLTYEQKEDLKGIFRYAEDNGSVMWQHVISFDNRWLEQQGLYNSQNHTVNELKLKELTRIAMLRLNKNEGLDNAIWSAAIHFNTDNIHIHIAEVEPKPMREMKGNEVRGKIKRSSLEKAKSAVVSNIIEHQPENEIINNIIRNNIIEGKKHDELVNDREFTDLFIKTLSQLPKDKRLWNYRSNAIKDLIPNIDQLSKLYIEKYHAKDLEELNQLLRKQDEKYRTAYGSGSTNRSYADNKKKDMYYRLGNVILKQMKEFDKNEKNRIYQDAKNRRIKIRQRDLEIFNKRNLRYRETQTTLKTAIGITKMFLKDEVEKFKNEIAYEILEAELQAAKEEEKEK